jgi:HD-GYP domain-containing protein (c-di-GMP phosphodiesterase class II)
VKVQTLQHDTALVAGSISADAALRSRLRDVGIVLLVCTEQGELAAPAAPAGEDWLRDLLVRSSMFRAALRDVVRRWDGEVEAAPVELFPGLWVVPAPVVVRRRRVGFSVGVIPTECLVESEHAGEPEFLAALCQSSTSVVAGDGGADLPLIRSLLRQLPLASGNAAEIHRLSALLRLAHEQHASLCTQHAALEDVGKQLAESYEEMSMLYTITQNMGVQQQPERFVANTCQELLRTLSYAWVGALLSDDRTRPRSLAGRLIVAGQPPRGRSSAMLRDAARMLLPHMLPAGALVLDGRRTDQLHQELLQAFGQTVVVQPVTSNEEVIGVLIAGDKRRAPGGGGGENVRHGPGTSSYALESLSPGHRDSSVSNVDIKLLGAAATHMAIFLENAALYDDLNAMFLGTLEALTASIDAKDRYTCGHSRRVAFLTQHLAKAIELDEYTVGRMRIAGLVHDVGKIGVPEAVLLKPGRLSTEEFALIQKHPEIGYRILKDIPQLGDILPGVLHHHERWDGKGYPHGIAREEIPLIARLIGLADAFDAMSTTRIYRSSLTRPQVLEEIVKCGGTQFDPHLARVFVQLDFAEFDQLVMEHRAIDLGDAPHLREKAA